MESGWNPAATSLCAHILFLTNPCQEEHGNMSNAGECLITFESKLDTAMHTANGPPSSLTAAERPLSDSSCDFDVIPGDRRHI